MGQAPVIHVCSEPTSRASRIAQQLSYASGEVLVVPPGRPDLVTLKSLIESRTPSVLVFHETGLLPSCLVTAAIGRARRLPHTIVFDVHDLYDPSVSSRGKRRTRLNTFAVSSMLRMLPRLGVRLMAVSEGLADSIQDAAGVRPQVVMNAPDRCSPSRKVASDRVVYFGLIRPDRISIRDVRLLQSEGWIIDVYGYAPASSAEHEARLTEVIGENGGRYLGPYAPDDLSFLDGYAASLMIFGNDSTNIRNSMPNKLFQSLCAGCPSVVSPFLDEVRATYGVSGAVPTLSEFIASPRRDVDWEAVATITARIRRESEAAYVSVIRP